MCRDKSYLAGYQAGLAVCDAYKRGDGDAFKVAKEVDNVRTETVPAPEYVTYRAEIKHHGYDQDQTTDTYDNAIQWLARRIAVALPPGTDFNTSEQVQLAIRLYWQYS